jgi:hypothetical protein
MSTQTELEKVNEKLGRVTREFLGREITEKIYDELTATEAAGLLKALSAHSEFRELALQHGSPFAQANIWLNAKATGVDLDFLDVERMSRGLEPLSSYQDELTPTESDLQAASRRFTVASNTPPALDPAAAQTRLSELMRDPEWASKALTRGTREAEENLRLNMLATGATPNALDVERAANGYGPSSQASTELRFETRADRMSTQID